MRQSSLPARLSGGSARPLILAVVSTLFLAGSAVAIPEPWAHPDGTFHYYDAIPAPAGIRWSAAFDSARARGGYLATIASPAEEKVAFGPADTPSVWFSRPGTGLQAGPWLGGFRPGASQDSSGGWQWVTGEPFDYKNWSHHEPDNLGGGENALELGESAGTRVPTWNDVSSADSVQRGYELELSADTTSVGLTKITPDTSPGYTLFDCLMGNYTYLIDNRGRLVHSWRSSYGTASSVYLLENGQLMRNDNTNPTVFKMGGRIEIMNWDGSVAWSLPYATATYCNHHDAIMLPNGHILMTVWELKSRNDAIAAGRDPSKVGTPGIWPEALIEVDTATKAVVWEWHMWDHLVQDFDSTKANYGVVANHSELLDANFGPAGDWVHMNALDYNQEFNQIIMSAHNFDEVWVIDHSTTTQEAASHSGGRYGQGGDLLYRWGNPRTYRAGDSTSQRFYLLHSAQWIRDGLPGAGHMMVFNNGQGRPDGNYSTVEEWIPPVDSSGFYARPTPGSPFEPAAPCWGYGGNPHSEFYSFNVSGAQRQPNGNTLICVGARGTFREVKPDSTIVWGYVNPMANSRAVFQGDTVPNNPQFRQNIAFRAIRYPADYPGLAGKDLTPGYPLEPYRRPKTPAPEAQAPADHRIVSTLTPKLQVGAIPYFGYDTFHFRLFAQGGATPIQETTLTAAAWTVATLAPGWYEWDCQAHSADSWTGFFAPRNDFMVVPMSTGWSLREPMPFGLKLKNVRDGGALTPMLSPASDTPYVYALKGNNTREFYAYNTIANRWDTQDSIPTFNRQGKKKAVKKGSSLVAGPDGKLYITKGGNTLEFWQYDPAKPAGLRWTQKTDVPISLRKCREGVSSVGVPLSFPDGSDSSFIYLLKGSGTFEFYRYDVAKDTWQALADAPAGMTLKAYKAGSSIAWDGSDTIFAMKGAYNEFFAYSIAGNNWVMKEMLPLGKPRRKARDGAAIAYAGPPAGRAGRSVYALKGGNTDEFWYYRCDSHAWVQGPFLQSGIKRVKNGGGLICDPDMGALYALRGNNTREFLSYSLPVVFSARQASGDGASSTSVPEILRYALRVSPNPLRGQAEISFTLPRPGIISLKLYDVTGRVTSTLASGEAQAGVSRVALSATLLPRGIYLLKFKGPGCGSTEKLILE